MTTKQLIFGVFFLLAVVVLGGMGSFVAIKRYERQAQINAQTEIERTKIENQARVEQAKIEKDTALARTKERMNLVPWYKGGENKEQQK